MNELDVLRKALAKQAQRIANLTLDLDLAHSQIDMLTEQLNGKDEMNAE
ncbi:MAG: hypothetical protein ACQEXB_24615 [Bacillota bacterium]